MTVISDFSRAFKRRPASIARASRSRYTRTSVNLHKEFESYAWKINKDGETVGIEDPKCPNHLMSATRYALTMFAGSMYDPQRKDRERVEVAVTRQKQAENQSR
ncbi:MAG: Terminase RNAseH like domain [Rhizobium sp.]|nr:Terminase RNAseH like domain [Rhizobium sp.]